MAYRRKRQTVTLEYGPGSDFPGLSVEVRPMSVETWLAVNGLSEDVTASGDLTLRGAFSILAAFADHLVSWNLEDQDTGEPVPVDKALEEDVAFLNRLASDWMGRATGVSAPLPPASSGTEPLPEVSLPMEPLSQLPRNLSGPS